MIGGAILAAPQTKDVVADANARIIGARSDLESMPCEELLSEGARTKLLAVTAVGPEVVAGYADLANSIDGWLQSEQCIALGPLDIHLHKCDIFDSVLLTDVFKGARLYRYSSGSLTKLD